MVMIFLCGVSAIALDKDDEARDDVTTPLYKAVYHEDLDLVVTLIKKGANVNAKNKAYSQKYKHIEVIERLETPLFIAVRFGTIEMVRELLDNGAMVNVTAPFYGTPLHCAIYNDKTEMVRVLLDNGAKLEVGSRLEGTPLHCAVSKGNPEIVRMLLDKGADVNAMMKIDSSWFVSGTEKKDTSISPLHTLVTGVYHWEKQQARIDIMKMLIARGADVNAYDPLFGMTPLHCAVKHREPELMKVLVENGADVNAHGTGKYSDITPLHCAIESHEYKMAKYLISHGAKDEDNGVITEEEKSFAQSQRSAVINSSLTLGIPLAYLGTSIYCYEFRFKHNRSANGMGTLNAFALSTFGFAAAGYMLGSVLLSGGTRDNGLQMLAGGMFGVLIGVPAGLVFMHYQHLPRNAKRNRGLYYAAPAASMMIPIVVFSRHF